MKLSRKAPIFFCKFLQKILQNCSPPWTSEALPKPKRHAERPNLTSLSFPEAHFDRSACLLKNANFLQILRKQNFCPKKIWGFGGHFCNFFCKTRRLEEFLNFTKKFNNFFQKFSYAWKKWPPNPKRFVEDRNHDLRRSWKLKRLAQ